MNLFKEHVYTVCEIVIQYLEYLDNQVTRATEAQNATKKELSIEEFLIRKLKFASLVDLFWSDCFSKI